MRLFLSSTYEDLAAHRLVAAQAIERLGQQGIRMEVFGARPSDASTVSFDEIDGSDAFVGIYAHRYGFVPNDGPLSITEQEFDFARARQKPAFCFLVDDDYPWPPRHVEAEPGRSRLQTFKARLRQQIVTDVFTSPEDLAYKLAAALGRFLLATKIKSELDRVPGGGGLSTERGRSQVARRASRIQELLAGARVLVVNDVPWEMQHLIDVLGNLNVAVEARTTSESALQALADQHFDVVISDMARAGTNDEGLRFLGQMQVSGFAQPLIFTVGRLDPDEGVPGHAFGITNRVDELLNLLFDALERLKG